MCCTFVDQLRVEQLVKEAQGAAGDSEEPDDVIKPEEEEEEAKEGEHDIGEEREEQEDNDNTPHSTVQKVNNTHIYYTSLSLSL